VIAARVRQPSFAALRRPRPPGRRLVLGALLVVVVAAALALRVEAAGDRAGHASADERAYVRLAGDLRAGLGYGDPGLAHPLHRAPGAPVLFAAADWAGGHPAAGGIDARAARGAQALVGALTVLVAFALAALLSGLGAGLVTAAVLAVYPPMVAATTHLTSELRHRPLFRVPEKLFLDAVAARRSGLPRDAAISAELHRNLRVYLLGHPVAFARMLAAKAWRMWAFPYRGTFRQAGATTIWVHRALVALALAGLLGGLFVARSPGLALCLIALGATAAVNLAFVAEARHAFRLIPALLACGAAGWALALPALRRAAGADGVSAPR
jgi:hypothetical protein